MMKKKKMIVLFFNSLRTKWLVIKYFFYFIVQIKFIFKAKYKYINTYKLF